MSSNPFRVLQQHKNFRLFWFGQTLSLVGSWMQTMAQGWLALELSNSPLVVGVVAAASSLPIVLLSIAAGVVVDRSDKLRLVTIAQTLLLIEAAALWWFTWSGHITIPALVTLAAIAGVVQTFEIPARQSLVIELVGREHLRSAIALNSTGFNLGRIVGPSLAALIIARAGIAWCFAVNALSYLAVLIGLLLIRLPPQRQGAAPALAVSPLEGIREGIRYIRETPLVRALIRLVAVYAVLGVPYLALMPVVARDMLGLGPGGYGLLLACVGIGGLVGALWLAGRGDLERGRGQLLAQASFAFAVLLIAVSFVRSAHVAYGFLLAIGFTMIVNNAVANALLQHIVPDEMRGRIMAAYSLIVVGLSQTIGAFGAGAVAKVAGVQWAIGGGAAAMLVYAIWAFRRFPELTS
ncbi:MAG: MFS transporter [Gemmatimonadota bacterium]|nr:MFS transporter [Gemmatimonadota bacterium]